MTACQPCAGPDTFWKPTRRTVFSQKGGVHLPKSSLLGLKLGNFPYLVSEHSFYSFPKETLLTSTSYLKFGPANSLPD